MLDSRSITQRFRQGHSAGFTLLELLVVMLIIGVLATMVSLSVSGRAADDRMQAESRRLEELLRLASDEAQAKGLELGFRQTTEGFEFLTPDSESGAWAVLAEGMFRPRQVQEPFFLELRVDGRLLRPATAVPKVEDEDEEDAAPGRASVDKTLRVEPQILILSSGEMTPFTLDLKLKDMTQFYRVEGNEMGELKSQREQPKQS